LARGVLNSDARRKAAKIEANLDWWADLIRDIAREFHSVVGLITHDYPNNISAFVVGSGHHARHEVKIEGYALNPQRLILTACFAAPMPQNGRSGSMASRGSHFRGMGAFLWVDGHPEPRNGVAIAVLRPRSDDYSEEEKDKFYSRIPMLKAVAAQFEPWPTMNNVKAEDKRLLHLEQYLERLENTEDNISNISYFRVVTKPTLDKTNDFLAAEGVPERDRPAMAAPIAQLIEDCHRNPPVAKATLAAMTAVQSIGAGTPAAHSVTDKLPSIAQGNGQPSDDAPATHADRITKARKNAASPASPEEVREARRLLSWQARHKDISVNADELRNARRVVRWADREKQRQAQAKAGRAS
jgi:hypothetical protein